MGVSFQYGQAKQNRLHATTEHIGSMVQKVVRCDRCGNVCALFGNKAGCVFRRNMLKNDFKVGKGRNDRDEVLVDKNLFSIENIDLGISDFSMNEQRELVLLHRFKNRVQGSDCADAGI